MGYIRHNSRKIKEAFAIISWSEWGKDGATTSENRVLDTIKDAERNFIEGVLGATGLEVSSETNWTQAFESLRQYIDNVATIQEQCRNATSAMRDEIQEIAWTKVANAAKEACMQGYSEKNGTADIFMPEWKRSSRESWCAHFVNYFLEENHYKTSNSAFGGSFIGINAPGLHSSIYCGNGTTANGNWSDRAMLVPIEKLGRVVWYVPPPYTGIGDKSQAYIGPPSEMPVGSVVVTMGNPNTGHRKRNKSRDRNGRA